MNVVGLMVFNNCYFTANALAAELPEVFAVNSQYLVQLWGLAYLATAKRWMHMPLLCFVFCLEKMLYTYFWVDYIADETTRQKLVSMVINYDDVQTGSFLLLFGINDFIRSSFCICCGLLPTKRERKIKFALKNAYF